jgi:hypothetical protein
MADGLMQPVLDSSGMCEQIGVETSGEQLPSSTMTVGLAFEK